MDRERPLENPLSTRRQVDALVASVYATLRDLAGRAIQRAPGRRSISPTDLLHDCYLKLVHSRGVQGFDQEQFIALTARVLRNLLVDRERARRTLKRGAAHERLTLRDVPLENSESVDLLDLDVALERLAAVDERQARIVELRFFGGLTQEEIAHALGCSVRTVAGDWKMARAWLHRELSRMESEDESPSQ